jgi:hypothetical protein
MVHTVQSDALKELYASSGTGVILYTLELSHPSWASRFYIVNDFQNFTANLENAGPSVEFQRFAFELRGPEKNDQGDVYLQLTIDNVSTQMVDFLELAAADTNNVPINMVYRVYIDTDTTGPQINPPLELKLHNARVTNRRMSGQAAMVNFVNRKFPNVVYGNVFQSLVVNS